MPKKTIDHDAVLSIRLPSPTLARLHALATRTDMRSSALTRVALGVQLTPELHLKLSQRLGLDWRCSRGQLTSAVQDALASLTDIDLEASKGLTDEQFVAFACAGHKRRSKPAPSTATKPAPTSGAKPAPKRSAVVETALQELDRLRGEAAAEQPESLPSALRRRTRSGMGSSSFWLMSHEALQQRVVRSIREARTPLTALAPVATQGSQLPLTIENGVAWVRVEGVLTPAPDLMALYYGEPNTTYPALQDALSAALKNPGVGQIVWSIDSPGGSVDGLFALLDDIEDARGKKPMSVLADNAHSAAYGIAAAVGRIKASGRTSSFGSVGVATSGFIQGGLCGTVVDITSSDAPEKRPDLATPEGKAVVTRYLDQLASEFMGTIARGRGVALDSVRAGYGRGSSMLAKAALEAKLIDGIAGKVR